MSNEVKGNGVSRRTVLKGAALGGLGVVGGGTLLSSCGKKKATGPVKFTVRGTGEAGIKIAQEIGRAHV